jgi:hypothetical protein
MLILYGEFISNSDLRSPIHFSYICVVSFAYNVRIGGFEMIHVSPLAFIILVEFRLS